MAEVEGNGSHDKPSSKLPRWARDRNLGSGLGESRAGKSEVRSGTHVRYRVVGQQLEHPCRGQGRIGTKNQLQGEHSHHGDQRTLLFFPLPETWLRPGPRRPEF